MCIDTSLPYSFLLSRGVWVLQRLKMVTQWQKFGRLRRPKESRGFHAYHRTQCNGRASFRVVDDRLTHQDWYTRSATILCLVFLSVYILHIYILCLLYIYIHIYYNIYILLYIYITYITYIYIYMHMIFRYFTVWVSTPRHLPHTYCQ